MRLGSSCSDYKVVCDCRFAGDFKDFDIDGLFIVKGIVAMFYYFECFFYIFIHGKVCVLECSF